MYRKRTEYDFYLTYKELQSLLYSIYYKVPIKEFATKTLWKKSDMTPIRLDYDPEKDHKISMRTRNANNEILKAYTKCLERKNLEYKKLLFDFQDPEQRANVNKTNINDYFQHVQVLHQGNFSRRFNATVDWKLTELLLIFEVFDLPLTLNLAFEKDSIRDKQYRFLNDKMNIIDQLYIFLSLERYSVHEINKCFNLPSTKRVDIFSRKNYSVNKLMDAVQVIGGEILIEPKLEVLEKYSKIKKKLDTFPESDAIITFKKNDQIILDYVRDLKISQ